MISGCGLLLIRLNVKEHKFLKFFLCNHFDVIGLYYETSYQGRPMCKVLLLDLYHNIIPSWKNVFSIEEIITKINFIEEIKVYKLKNPEIYPKFKLLLIKHFSDSFTVRSKDILVDILNMVPLPSIKITENFFNDLFEKNNFAIFDPDLSFFETPYFIDFPSIEKSLPTSLNFIRELSDEIIKYISDFSSEEIINFFNKLSDIRYNFDRSVYRESDEFKHKTVRLLNHMIKNKEVDLEDFKFLENNDNRLSEIKHDIYINLKTDSKIKLISNSNIPENDIHDQLCSLILDIKNEKIIKIDINRLIKNISNLVGYNFETFKDIFTINGIVFSKGSENLVYEEIKMDDGLIIIPSKKYSLSGLSKSQLIKIYEHLIKIDDQRFKQIKNDIIINLSQMK